MKRFGCFGFAMEVKKGLRLEKGTQTKENFMEKLGHGNVFVQRRVTERKIKGDHLTKFQELKLEPIVKFAWVL